MTNSEVEYMTAAQYHTIAQCSGDTFGFKGFLHFWPSEPRKVQLKRQKEGVSVIKIVMADKSAPMHITVRRDQVEKFLEFSRHLPAEGRVMTAVKGVTAKKEYGNEQNVVTNPMRTLHSTSQTEYELLEDTPSSCIDQQAFPKSLLTLRFAELSKCTKPTTLNLVGFIDQVKTRETESGNFLAKGRIRDKTGHYLEFGALGRHAHTIARREQGGESSASGSLC